MGKLFGTDGARGVANTELTCQLAFDIGRAAAMVLAGELHRRPVFIIGKDTRISSDMLEAALSAGLCSVGANVVQLGVTPTPAVAYLVQAMGADAGVMLSASHNPFEYNGIKLFGPKGFKLTDAEEERIEELVLGDGSAYTLAQGGEIGSIRRDESALERYIAYIASTAGEPLSGLRVAFDCANGSASVTAQPLFERLGVEAVFLSRQPDGVNINRDCGSTHIDRLAAFVREQGLDAGFAFDGDADRCLAVDAAGELVDGDRIIAVLASQLHREGKLKGEAAVVTVMSNVGFFKFCERAGLTASTTKVGDRYVLERMLEADLSIGGEQSGHIILREYMPTGDGQLTAVQLLRAMKRTGLSLRELASVMQVYPQVIRNVRADSAGKARFASDEQIAACIERHKTQLGGDGRVLVRPSGTEALIRVMVEGMDHREIEAIADDIAQTIEERLAE